MTTATDAKINTANFISITPDQRRILNMIFKNRYNNMMLDAVDFILEKQGDVNVNDVARAMRVQRSELSNALGVFIMYHERLCSVYKV